MTLADMAGVVAGVLVVLLVGTDVRALVRGKRTGRER